MLTAFIQFLYMILLIQLPLRPRLKLRNFCLTSSCSIALVVNSSTGKYIREELGEPYMLMAFAQGQAEGKFTAETVSA